MTKSYSHCWFSLHPGVPKSDDIKTSVSWVHHHQCTPCQYYPIWDENHPPQTAILGICWNNIGAVPQDNFIGDQAFPWNHLIGDGIGDSSWSGSLDIRSFGRDDLVLSPDFLEKVPCNWIFGLKVFGIGTLIGCDLVSGSFGATCACQGFWSTLVLE